MLLKKRKRDANALAVHTTAPPKTTPAVVVGIKSYAPFIIQTHKQSRLCLLKAESALFVH